ncbi:MAG: DinB family protein [Gemmatimonadales bacterium]|nr:DinB family protein [Gemmatimonadales bacterium]MYC88686.1 DinB family protein [Candidatus Palauibacter denitrificans]
MGSRSSVAKPAADGSVPRGLITATGGERVTEETTNETIIDDDALAEDILTLLARTPGTVRVLLEDLPPDLLHADEGEGTFSPFSVLGHLIQGEIDDWLPRTRWILEHGRQRPFPPFDRFAHIERTRNRPLDELLTEFETLRGTGLAALREVIREGVDLDAGGLHPELGEVTLRQLLTTWAVHDLNHIAQITRVVAHQFEDEVGPWKVYLPILHHDR